ncbi:Protein acetyltransferase [Oxalobacteraceae bacterium IMCC9480]|nr:Protein acetyltransferase [Oxalobacteraceae bacterium IMCC9480]NDP60282.1 bifunctional acetate--CoA ligase family protein/GNAT family N-acetyltransferase [Oxalobacteraceae bacterium]
MSIRHLQALFNPASVALIGATNRPGSIGNAVLHNLVAGGFAGRIMPVNPKHEVLAGLIVWNDVASLPVVPDLAIICTPPASVPELIAALGERGCKAVIVMSAVTTAQREAMLLAAKPHLLRILGDISAGLLVPAIGLNASFSSGPALPGKLAFVSQSGGLMNGVLDWATTRGLGFSKFISLGGGADIDFGDLLDFLAGDPATHAILLFLEDIRLARKFMSAARSAARGKPILVIRAGRSGEGQRAGASHTGVLASPDSIYDAAIRRAGMLRVNSTEALFGAVETLARAKPMHGERLTILTNGGGPGIMANDALLGLNGRLATLTPKSVTALAQVLPSSWSQTNPVDLGGDAPVERYRDALAVLLNDANSDAILFIHAPGALVSSTDIARALVPLMKQSSRNVLTCWLGGAAVSVARQLCSAAGIATYDTPEEAVRGFMQIIDFRHNQQLLMQVPPALLDHGTTGRLRAQALVRAALADGRTLLSEPETKIILAAYGIPVVETSTAATVDEAVLQAQRIGFPVAIKILSPQIWHKSDVGGVALDLEDADAVRHAARAMHKRLCELQPDAELQGFAVQAMARRPQAHELIVGVSTDPVFGPVILFGQGGIAVEVLDDHAVGLPPLNSVLAGDMIARTRVARLLAGYRNRPAADLEAINRTLIQISSLVEDLPELVELDINPLLADGHGVIALDARMRVAKPRSTSRLAIRPYPQSLEQVTDWHGEALTIRPIKPEDGEAHVIFFNQLSAGDVRYRAFSSIRQLQEPQVARLTQIDYDREMAFIATRVGADGQRETLGVARAVADADNHEAEFAIIVRSDMKGRGLGRLLMQRLIDYCRSRGTHFIIGETMSDNKGLLTLTQKLGFIASPIPEEHIMSLRLDLG